MSLRSSQLLLSVLAGVTFLLQACASGAPFSGLAPVPENHALLYLYREGRIVGAAGSNEVYVNGKPIVELKNGGYFVVTLDPGPVIISNRAAGYRLLNIIDRALEPEKVPKVTFTAEPNRVYYVEGLLAGKLELRERDTAFPVLKNCTLLSPLDL